MSMPEAVRFIDEDGKETVFYCVEQTQLAGHTYLLVTDRAEGDADCWVLKDISATSDEEARYEILEEGDELKAVADVFALLLEDVDLE